MLLMMRHPKMHKKRNYYYAGGEKRYYPTFKSTPTFLIKHEVEVVLDHPTSYRITSKSREDGSRRTFTRRVEDMTRIRFKQQLKSVTPDVAEFADAANSSRYVVQEDGNIIRMISWKELKKNMQI